MQILKPSLLLALFVALLWMSLYEKFSPVAWRTPISYSGDDPQVLGWLKAASQGDYPLLLAKRVHRVGAPDDHANWHEFPMYGELEIWVLGTVFHNPVVAANVGMLAARVTAALGFFLAAVLILRVRTLWAWVGAVAWACVHYHTFRGMGHMFLGFTWAVPFIVAASWRLSALPMPAVMAVGAALGLSNPYFTAMGALFILLAGGSQYKRMVALCWAGCTFLLFNADTLLSAGCKLTRQYFESELYALKPIELILPPPGHWLGFLSAGYAQHAAIRGEMFSPFLGLVALVALVWMVICWRESGRELLQVGGTIIASSIGGLGAMLALCSVTMFRASNRWSVFVAAIALLWLVQRLSSKQWTGERTFWTAALLLAIPCAEMLKVRPHEACTPQLAQYRQDVQFGKDLEAAMPGAILYCFPPMTFPDTNPVGGVQPYDMLRPWLHTSSVRFSAGKVRTRLDDYESLKMWPSVETLNAKGFTGILVSRKVFEDGGQGFMDSLKDSAAIIVSSPEFIAVSQPPLK